MFEKVQIAKKKPTFLTFPHKNFTPVQSYEAGGHFGTTPLKIMYKH